MFYFSVVKQIKMKYQALFIIALIAVSHAEFLGSQQVESDFEIGSEVAADCGDIVVSVGNECGAGYCAPPMKYCVRNSETGCGCRT